MPPVGPVIADLNGQYPVVGQDVQQADDDRLRVLDADLADGDREFPRSAQIPADRAASREVHVAAAATGAGGPGVHGAGAGAGLLERDRPGTGQVLIGHLLEPLPSFPGQHVHLDGQRSAHLIQQNAGDLGPVLRGVVVQRVVRVAPAVRLGGDLVEVDVVEAEQAGLL